MHPEIVANVMRYFLVRRIVYRHVNYCVLGPDNTGDDVYRHGQVWEVPLRPKYNKKYVFVAEVHQRNTCLVCVTL